MTLRTIAFAAAIGGFACVGAYDLAHGRLSTGLAGLFLAAANALLFT